MRSFAERMAANAKIHSTKKAAGSINGNGVWMVWFFFFEAENIGYRCVMFGLF
jgi:hypothetical protein